MINIQKREIIEYATNTSVYRKGQQLYKESAVIDFEYDDNNNKIKTKVKDEERIYHPEISLDLSEEVYDGKCDCEAYGKWFGFCKHLVATLLYSEEIEERQKKGMSLYSDPKAEVFLSRVYEVENRDKDNLKLEYFLEMSYQRPELYMWFKIGEEKQYIIKKLREFLIAYRTRESYKFGIHYEYDPYAEKFEGIDLEIINLLLNVLDEEESYSQVSWSANHAKFFEGKKVVLLGAIREKVLDILIGQEVTLINYEGENSCQIISRNVPINIAFIKQHQGIVMRGDFVDYLPITMDGKWIFDGKDFCKQSDERMKKYGDWLNVLLNQQQELFIGKDIQEEFLSTLIPKMRQLGSVSLSPTLANKIVNEKVKGKVTLDKTNAGISAKVAFYYGDVIIDAINPTSLATKIKDDKLVLRDFDYENEVMAIFERNDFVVRKDAYHLSEDDGIFEFLINDFYNLYEKVDLFTSKSFDKITIKEQNDMSSSLAYHESMDYFTFNFSVEGLDIKNMKHLLKAIKENQKYYKVKKDEYIRLDNDFMKTIHELSDFIELSKEEKDGFVIPKYAAVYLSDQFDQLRDVKIKKNLAFKELIMSIKDPQDVNYPVPQEVNDILRDYQHTGYNWLRTLSVYGLGGILADDMGLGKTLQTLTYIRSLHDDSKALSLIIAPTSLQYNWEREINRFFPSLKVQILIGNKEERLEIIEDMDEVDIVIVSYHLARNDIDVLEKIKFQNIILDEAQHIKNSQSKTAKAVKQLNATHKFALTGTPLENSVLELWSIFDFVMPGFLKSQSAFKDKYFEENRYKELNRIISPFVLRRLKSDVLSELPDKIENTIVVPLSDSQKELYVSYLEKIREEIRFKVESEGYGNSQMQILSALTRLRQICCDPSIFIDDYEGDSSKMSLLSELVDELVAGNHRILIFSQFTSILRIIEKMLEEKAIEYGVIEGKVKAKDRNDIVEAFNEGKGQVMLISLRAGGTGLNLTGADTVIHFDPWWNPAVENQATDRAHRIGQKKVVQVIKMITEGTIEEKIFELQKKKTQMIDQIVGPKETFITQLDRKELFELFDLDI